MRICRHLREVLRRSLLISRLRLNITILTNAMCPHKFHAQSSTAKSGLRIFSIRLLDLRSLTSLNIWEFSQSMEICIFLMMTSKNAWNSSKCWAKIGWVLNRSSMFSARRREKISRCIRLDLLCRIEIQSLPIGPEVDFQRGLMSKLTWLNPLKISNHKWTCPKPRQAQI